MSDYTTPETTPARQNGFPAAVYTTADNLSIYPAPANLQRVEKAIAIAEADVITPVSSNGTQHFDVPSQDNDVDLYRVEIHDAFNASCTCPDPNNNCKHIVAVRLHLQARTEASWAGVSVDEKATAQEWLETFKPDESPKVEQLEARLEKGRALWRADQQIKAEMQSEIDRLKAHAERLEKALADKDEEVAAVFKLLDEIVGDLAVAARRSHDAYKRAKPYANGRESDV